MFFLAMQVILLSMVIVDPIYLTKVSFQNLLWQMFLMVMVLPILLTKVSFRCCLPHRLEIPIYLAKVSFQNLLLLAALLSGLTVVPLYLAKVSFQCKMPHRVEIYSTMLTNVIGQWASPTWRLCKANSPSCWPPNSQNVWLVAMPGLMRN